MKAKTDSIKVSPEVYKMAKEMAAVRGVSADEFVMFLIVKHHSPEIEKSKPVKTIKKLRVDFFEELTEKAKSALEFTWAIFLGNKWVIRENPKRIEFETGDPLRN